MAIRLTSDVDYYKIESPFTTPNVGTVVKPEVSVQEDNMVDVIANVLDQGADVWDSATNLLAQIGVVDKPNDSVSTVERKINSGLNEFSSNLFSSNLFSSFKSEILNEYRPLLWIGGGVLLVFLLRKLK